MLFARFRSRVPYSQAPCMVVVLIFSLRRSTLHHHPLAKTGDVNAAIDGRIRLSYVAISDI